jgi:hypothetical protein
MIKEIWMTSKNKPQQSQTNHLSPFDEPVIRAACGGMQIRTYGYTHVLAGAPDLAEATPLQTGNPRPLTRLPLKTSREIAFNRLGGTSPRMPRTEANDYLPLECIHLIDGDPTTCWSSKSLPQPDVEPVWIRLDLPVERDLSRIVLSKRAPGPARCTDMSSMPLDTNAVEVGMAMPAELTIRISRDARTWETVFDGPSGDSPEQLAFSCEFAARPAKQIWIIGRQLRRVENWLYAFSIASVAVYDTAGRNVALATRGTGVTVSSTQHSLGQTRDEHRWLWPLAVDLGVKWIRIGYHDDPVNWHWVEQEKGRLAVDPMADAAIDYLVERGVDIVLALGFGNRLYSNADPARHLPQLWEWYYENPCPPTTPEALEAWAGYVRFMARKYCGRIKVFEIWNEWNIGVYWGAQPSLEQYLAIARLTIPILRQECPQAKVMLGSYAGYFPGISTWSPDELAQQERDSLLLAAIRELAPEIDIIGWHPFYQTDPDKPAVRSYTADVRRFQDWCRTQGFHGDFCASEWSYGASYPEPTPPNWWGDYVCSELAKAKYVARLSVQHTALACDSFFCETWGNSYYAMDLTLMRRTFTSDPISPQQPQAAYYVMRNLATALENLQPAAFDFHVEGGPADLEQFALERPGEQVVTLWQPGQAADDCPGVPADLILSGRCRQATGYDPLNGVEQELDLEFVDGGTRIRGLLIKDYPILVRFLA